MNRFYPIKVTTSSLSLCLIVILSLLSISQFFRVLADDLWINSLEQDEAATRRFFRVGDPTTGRRRGSSQPPRILLGILSTIEMGGQRNNEVKLRVILRKTYLSFDKVHGTTTPNRVCSLEEFSSKASSNDWKPYECQLVYTFVFGGVNSTLDWDTAIGSSSSLTTPLVLPESKGMETLMQRETKHKDYLFLNANNRDSGGKIWSWYRYTQAYWRSGDEGGVDAGGSPFDYVGHTDCTVKIHPTEFWQNSIFVSQPHHEGVYAGYQVERSKCTSKETSQLQWCPSLEAPTMTQHLSLLSTDVADRLMREASSLNVAQVYGSLKEGESADVGLADLLHNLSPPVVSTPLKGVKPVLSNQLYWSDYLKQWDKYKDKVVMGDQGYSDPVEEARVKSSQAIKLFDATTTTTTTTTGPRILMGIFTMDSDSEKERRAAIRETYLSYYKNVGGKPYRICPLQDLVGGDGLVPNDGIVPDCQMAYTFVMGSNPNGPTELVGPNATFSMLVPEVPVALRGETDIVHLNIRENMEDGKTPTWFHYATTIVDEYFYFDYIGKTDTDTLLFPNYFLDTTFAKYPRFPNNVRVFGGQQLLKCEWASRMIGPLYMGGHLYWMSIDLARFISTMDRKAVDCGIEDMSMGNFVHSHPLPIRRIPIVGNKSYRHPLKDVHDFRQEWSNFEREESLATKLDTRIITTNRLQR